MKSFIIILLLFFSITLYSQEVLVIDSLTQHPIANVIFKTDRFQTISNKNGKVSLNLFYEKNPIHIEHIGYYKKIVSFNNVKDSVFLSPKTILLPVVVLSEQSKLLTGFVPSIFTISLNSSSQKENSISELLQKNSGVTIQENQAGGGSPNFRGMEANRLLIIIDDISLNNAIFRSGHLQNSSTINPFFLESINLISGPASVAYGNGAMGSALLFNTTTPFLSMKSANYLEQKFESSSNSIIVNYKNQFSKNSFAMLNAFSFRSSENLIMGGNRLHSYSNWGKGNTYTIGNEQLYTNYYKADFLTKIIAALDDKKTLLINTQYSMSSKINRIDKLNDLENNIQKYSDWYYGPHNRFSQSLRFKSAHSTLLYNKLSITLAFQNVSESRHHKKMYEALMSHRLENIKIYDGSFDFKKFIDKTKITYGFGGRKQLVTSLANRTSEEGAIFYNTTRYPDGGSFVNEYFIYSQLGTALTKNLDLYIGARYNKMDLTAHFNDTVTYSLPFSIIYTKNSSLVGSALISYKLSSSITLSTSLYTGFRNPNVDDIGKIFSKNDKSVVIPNPSLNPEKCENIELGLTGKFFEKLHVKLQFFNTIIKDAIQKDYAVLNGDSLMVYDGELMRIQMNKNIESANIAGVNISFAYNPTKKILIRSHYNFIKGKTFENKPLSHIPPINGSVDFEYILKNHKFKLYTNFNGWKSAEEYDLAGVDNLEEATSEGSPSWYTLNLYYSNSIDDTFNFDVGIKNIMDIHYKVFGSALSASGRNFVLSLRCNF